MIFTMHFSYNTVHSQRHWHALAMANVTVCQMLLVFVAINAGLAFIGIQVGKDVYYVIVIYKVQLTMLVMKLVIATVYLVVVLVVYDAINVCRGITISMQEGIPFLFYYSIPRFLATGIKIRTIMTYPSDC